MMKFLQFCTTLGALIVPMAFDTVYELSGSLDAAVVAAAYLIFGKVTRKFLFTEPNNFLKNLIIFFVN